MTGLAAASPAMSWVRWRIFIRAVHLDIDIDLFAARIEPEELAGVNSGRAKCTVDIDIAVAKIDAHFSKSV
jgi:hypothetical protein